MSAQHEEPSDAEPSDAELLAAVADGSTGALEELYRRHVGWVTVRLSRRCAETRQTRPGATARIAEPPPRTPPRRGQNHQKKTQPQSQGRTHRLNDKLR